MPFDLEDPEFKAVADLVAAQQEANRLKQSELSILRRREQIILNSIDETTKLRQEIRQLNDYYRKHALKEDALQDWFEVLSDRVSRLERGIMLTLMDRLDSPHVRAEGEVMVSELNAVLNTESKKRQLMQEHTNLREYQEREAEYAGEAPVSLLNKIKRTKEKIDKLDSELNA